MKRILSALLLSALLILTVSCGDGASVPSGGAADTADAGNAAAAEETTEAVETRAPVGAPTEDYDGYDFKILEYTQTEIGQRQFLDFGWTSEAAGDLINDAVQRRNMIVEGLLNITVDCVQEADVVVTGKKAILAGDDSYDVLMGYINKSFPLAQEGLLLNLYDVPNLDITAEWWDSAAIRDMALGGKIYVMTGDITMADEELNYCIFFNKAVWNEYNTADFYQLARDGKWTLDAMLDAGRTVTHDLNGDGVLDENDCFGILTSTSVASVWYFSAGGRIVELDAKGVPTLTIGSEQSVRIMDRLAALFADTQAVLEAANLSNQWKTCNAMLMEDRALFRVGSVYNIQQYRGMVNDFGILPYPKYDEAQQNYAHLIATQVCASVNIPTTASDPARTGAILEHLAYESKDTVTTAYYDVNLYTKVARDDESGEMFDIIFATKCYDLGKVFAWGGLENVINKAAADGSFSSAVASALPKAQTAMETSYSYFAD